MSEDNQLSEKFELEEFDFDDFYRVLNRLDSFHGIMKTIWKIGKPYFCERIETACISFDKEGNEIQFIFNPKFWNSLDDYTRCFVICHECLHIMLRHGVRGKDCEFQEIANIAMDVAVNHMLFDSFEFDLELIDEEWQKKLCIVQNVWKDMEVNPTMNFEYYYNLLIKNAVKIEMRSLDLHSSLEGFGIEELNEILEQNGLNKFDEEVEKDVEKEVKSALEFGNGIGVPGEPLVTGTGYFNFIEKKVKPTSKWDKLFDKIDMDYQDQYEETFILKNRRLGTLSSKFILPFDSEMEKLTQDIPNIFMFLDCSGSCSNLVGQFWEMAQTINTKKYRVRFLARTTEVKEIQKNQILRNIDGSDDFRCIENYIQSELKAKRIKRYPIVIHLTDGGDCSNVLVVPECPKMWHTILKGNLTKWCPEDSNIYKFEDFK